ncbi:hypothetical protein ACOSP7_000726 [Xanthoceras sorbifolium]
MFMIDNGAVIRDDVGSVLLAVSKLDYGTFSSEMGEIVALRTALAIVQYMHLSIDLVGCDSLPLCCSKA